MVGRATVGVGFDHEPHDQQSQQRHRLHGAGETATRTGANDGAVRRRRCTKTPVILAAAGVTVSVSALTVTEEDTTGEQLHGGPRPPADGECHGDGRGGFGGLGCDRQPGHPDLHDRRNWDMSQTVTVTAGNDADTANDTVTLTHSASSSDSQL